MTDPIVTTTYDTIRVKYTHWGTWQFYASWAVSFGYRAVPTHDTNCKVVRLWLDNVLVYDLYAGIGTFNFRFYPGTEDQPFYRGQMVIFFDNYPLADQNGIPAVSAEIVDGAALGSVVNDIYVARSLTLVASSRDYDRIMQVAADGNGGAVFRILDLRSNSIAGSQFISGIDLTKPVIFVPLTPYVLAQRSADKAKVLLNVSATSARATSIWGGANTTIATLTDFPPFDFGIAQNAGTTFGSASQFFLLSSPQAGGVWPYQVLFVVNGDRLAYGAGVGRSWADEPKCMVRGDMHAGTAGPFSTSLAQRSAGPTPNGSGDVLVASDYAIRKLTIGQAGSAAVGANAIDVPLYSHASTVGKIVRLYYQQGGNIIALIETDAATHAGFVRAINYADGSVVWNSSAIELDDVAGKQERTNQGTSDINSGVLGVISAHTPGVYTLISLIDGTTETGTFTGFSLTAGEPAIWISGRESFFSLTTDNKALHVGVPSTAGIALSLALSSLAQRAGYTEAQIHISGLDDVFIMGYIVGSDTTLGTILDNMSTLYQFSYAEIGDDLYITAIYTDDAFVSTVTIPEADLAVLTEGQPDDRQIVNSTLSDDASMPLALAVTYIDPDIEYQQGTQSVRRMNTPQRTTQSNGTSSFSLPVVAHGADMLMRLYKALYATWASQTGHSLRLPPKYLHLLPAQGFTFSALGFDHEVTAVAVTINSDFSVSLSATERAGASQSPTVTTQTPERPAQRGPVAPIRALLLDIADTTAGMASEGFLNLGAALSSYVAGQWVGGRLDAASATDPSSWATRVATSQEAPVGTVLSYTPSPDHVGVFETDYGARLVIELGALTIADLPAATYAQMLDGANLLVVGRDGRYELLQYGNAIDNGDGTATLSVLMRGRYGTEQVVGMLAVGDNVVRYADLQFTTYPLADFTAHSIYIYRGVASGQNPETAPQAALIPNGNSMRPRAPANITAYKLSAGGIDVYWDRRERFNAGLSDGTAAIPETIGRVFSFDLYALDMTLIYRRYAPTTMTDALDHFVISDADLIAAGYDTSDLPFVNLYVYQVDAATVGRGWGAGGAIPVGVTGGALIGGWVGGYFYGDFRITRPAVHFSGSIAANEGAWTGNLTTTNSLYSGDIIANAAAFFADLSIGAHADLQGTMLAAPAIVGNLHLTGLVGEIAAVPLLTGRLAETTDPVPHRYWRIVPTDTFGA